MVERVELTSPEPGADNPDPNSQATATGPEAREQGADNQQPSDATQTQEGSSERPQWLPEKFKSPEELAKAYKELEGRLGGNETVEGGEQETTEGTEGEDGDGEKEGDGTDKDAERTPETVMSELASRFQENGELSDNDYELAKETWGVSKETVDAYVAGQKALADQIVSAADEAAGGREQRENMFKWAATNLSEEEVEAFNSRFSKGKEAAVNATKDLRARYEQANGFAPSRRISGGQAPSGPRPFGDVSEMTKAINDPKYAESAAYRKQVEERIAVSNF